MTPLINAQERDRSSPSVLDRIDDYLQLEKLHPGVDSIKKIDSMKLLKKLIPENVLGELIVDEEVWLTICIALKTGIRHNTEENSGYQFDASFVIPIANNLMLQHMTAQMKQSPSDTNQVSAVSKSVRGNMDENLQELFNQHQLQLEMIGNQLYVSNKSDESVSILIQYADGQSSWREVDSYSELEVGNIASPSRFSSRISEGSLFVKNEGEDATMLFILSSNTKISAFVKHGEERELARVSVRTEKNK